MWFHQKQLLQIHRACCGLELLFATGLTPQALFEPHVEKDLWLLTWYWLCAVI